MLFDIVGVGEALIDLTNPGKSARGNDLFEANPGGGVSNFLAMAAAMGKRCAFIGKVGEDVFGGTMREAFAEAGISTAGLVFDPEVRTTLAIVKNHPDGEREFSFFRSPGADMCLRTEEINKEVLLSAKALHFSSVTLTDEPAASATMGAAEMAKENGALISFDPNYRAMLWKSGEAARRMIWRGAELADVVKIGLDELLFLTGEKNAGAAIKKFRARCGAGFVTVTDGKNGASAYFGSERVSAPAELREDTVDCTGAGDVFGAVVLCLAMDAGLQNLDGEKALKIIKTAASAAAVVTTRSGAFRAVPKPGEFIRA